MSFYGGLVKLGKSVLDALLPEECVVCGEPLVDGEHYMCLHCRYEMPRVDISDLHDNAVHTTLATTNPVVKGVAWFRYRKGSPYTRIIHYAKYNDRPKLSHWVGVEFGRELEKRFFFDDIEAFVPVPLSFSKMLKRGYNQSEELANGLKKVSGIPVIKVLGARRHTTQTKKGASGRRSNARGVFYLKNRSELSGLSHIALVDDVITTGSTLLECADAIRSSYPAIKISVVAAALTEL